VAAEADPGFDAALVAHRRAVADFVAVVVEDALDPLPRRISRSGQLDITAASFTGIAIW
jgi:hypothetical protein